MIIIISIIPLSLVSAVTTTGLYISGYIASYKIITGLTLALEFMGELDLNYRHYSFSNRLCFIFWFEVIYDYWYLLNCGIWIFAVVVIVINLLFQLTLLFPL